MVTLTDVGILAGDGRTFAVSVNPATGEEIARYPHDDAEAQDAVVAAAVKAQKTWAGWSAIERQQHFAELAAILRQEIDLFAASITAEMGKTITAARAEVSKCAILCDWYASHSAALLADEKPNVGSDGDARISYLPLGLIFAVMPWNFPLWQVLRAAVPIMAAGNGFVLKHADNVQGCARLLAGAIAKTGMPEGLFSVLNIRRDAVSRLIADPRIAGVTVTSGVAAGAAVASEAGRHLKKSLLELGGSDPFIVLADSDLDRAVPAAIEARFQNCGQVCIAAKRIIVEEPIFEEFTRRFIAAAKALPQGDPAQAGTRIGPMARTRLRNELHEQVTRSLEMGAELLLGGEIPNGPGSFYPATVLIGVTPDMPVAREETFGPVAPIIKAKNAEDAIRIANDSDFGLSGAVWGSDVSKVTEVAEMLETGGVFINGISASDPRVPIGGIKQSGYGRELSHFGLREFCNAKLIWRRN